MGLTEDQRAKAISLLEEQLDYLDTLSKGDSKNTDREEIFGKRYFDTRRSIGTALRCHLIKTPDGDSYFKRINTAYQKFYKT